ncbi:MAG: hypothetical protein Q8Q11_02655 [bacterium]|nr:hypothetical protein [bacterium]MDZ4247947.1 hypothetical protein [Patescibacteria group bacterium]
MTRFIVGLAVLYLLLVAADPATYAEFGWTVGLFLCFAALFIGRIHKSAGGPVFAIGIIMFGIATLGSSYYQQIRIVALCAAAAGLLLIVSRLTRRRRNATRDQPRQNWQGN